MCQKTGLLLQVVMSFHQCGGNVGDDCNITLPWWVLNAGRIIYNISFDALNCIAANRLFYTDISGHSDLEYLSLGVDDVPLFNGRTPIQVYADFMSVFANTFKSYLGKQITLIEVPLFAVEQYM